MTEFINFKKSFIISIIILFAVLTLVPYKSICVDSADSGYCITLWGFPFSSFIVTGELFNIPSADLIGYILKGLLGSIGNLAISFAVVFLLSKIFKKKMKTEKNN